MAVSYPIVYMYYSFFIHLCVDGHLDCFHVLAIVNSAAVNSGVHVSFRIMVFLEYMSSSWIAGSYGSFIPIFFFFNINLRNRNTVLHSDFIKVNFHQLCKRIPFFPHPFSAVIVCRCFNDGHSGGYELIPHFSFDFHF